MKITAYLLLFLLLGVAHAGPDVQHWKTENGMRVYFVEARDIPMVDLRVTFSAGASRDNGIGGLASFTNSMLRQGAGNLDADAIAQSYERVGAAMGNGSLRDMAWLSLRSLSDARYIRQALDTFSKVLWEPRFAESDFTRIRKQYLLGLKAQLARPASIASKAFYKAMYGDHPYSKPISGSIESVSAITLAQIREFHRRYYVAKNGIISIVGDLDQAIAKQLAETLSAGLPVGQAAAPLPTVKPLEKGETIKIDFPSKQAHILIGSPAIARNNPDYFPLYLGNHGFGGGGLNSILSKKLREEKGYAYSVGSYFQVMEGPGAFRIGLQTRSAQVDDAIKLLRESLIAFIENGPDDDRLEMSVKNITGSFPMKVATNSNILQYLTLLGFYNMPLDYLETYNNKIKAVSKADIVAAFKKYLDPEKMITVIVGGEA